MAMASPIYYTADMVRAITDENRPWPRYELVHGELLVTPAPRRWHQVLVGRVYVALEAYLRHEPIGYPFLSPADISWGPDTLVQPDVFVTTLEDARKPNPDWEGVRNLLLATEVLSPFSARYDRFAKRRLYQEVGVPLYWIVDPEEQQVEVWTPTDLLPTVERERVVWHPSGAVQPFTLDLSQLFRPI